jgi:hypothetical protein
MEVVWRWKNHGCKKKMTVVSTWWTHRGFTSASTALPGDPRNGLCSIVLNLMGWLSSAKKRRL